LASGKSLQKQRAVIQVLESWILFQQGKSAEALRLLRNAELQLKVTDDHVSMGNIYSFRARMARREGRREDALVLWEQAVAAYQQRPASVGHPNMARALSYMAHVELLKAHALQRGADKLRVSAHAGGPGKRRKELIEKERHD
jgi:tetratricopeptide (TPR) repeat protein